MINLNPKSNAITGCKSVCMYTLGTLGDKFDLWLKKFVQILNMHVAGHHTCKE